MRTMALMIAQPVRSPVSAMTMLAPSSSNTKGLLNRDSSPRSSDGAARSCSWLGPNSSRRRCAWAVVSPSVRASSSCSSSTSGRFQKAVMPGMGFRLAALASNVFERSMLRQGAERR